MEINQFPELIEYKVVNDQGEVIETVLLPDDQSVPENHFRSWGNRGFFVPIWDFEKSEWIESLTAEEIAAIKEEIADSQNQITADEMNGIAILELSNLIFGGMGVE
jgi:hypothetical protein